MLQTGAGSRLQTSISAHHAQGGLTFFKDYSLMPEGEVSAERLQADYSLGSAAATMTASRGASNPGIYFDSNGIIRTVTTSNVGRKTAGYMDATGFVKRPGLLMENAATNLIKDSYFSIGSASYWGPAVGGTLSMSTDYANPIGGGQVAKHVCTAADHRFGLAAGNLPSVTAGTKYTASAFIRSTPGDPIYFRYSDGALQTSPKFTPLTDRWTFVQWTITAGFTATLLGFSIANKNAVSTTFYVAGFQFEQGAAATTFIPTTTGTLTRNAESLTYVCSGNRTAATETTFMKCTTLWGAATAASIPTTTMMIFDADTNTRDLGFYSSSAYMRANSGGGTSAWSSATEADLPTIGTSQVYSVGYSETGNPNGAGYKNGVAIGANSTTDFTTTGFGTNFYVGKDSGVTTRNLGGIIERVAIYSSMKSAADMLAISSF